MAGEQQPVSVGTVAVDPVAVVTPVIVGTPDTQPDKTGSVPTFTQEEVNAILAGRLKRAEEAATKRVLEALGVDNLETAKASVAATKTAEEANKTELQKLQDKLAAEVKKREVAETEVVRLGEAAKIGARNAEISKALTAANVKKVDDLMILLTNKHLTTVEAIGLPDGKADAKAIEALVKQAQTDYAEFFGNVAPGSPSNSKGKAPTDDAARSRAVSTTSRLARF